MKEVSIKCDLCNVGNAVEITLSGAYQMPGIAGDDDSIPVHFDLCHKHIADLVIGLSAWVKQLSTYRVSIGEVVKDRVKVKGDLKNLGRLYP